MSTELSSILLAAATTLQNLDREPFFCAVLERHNGQHVGPGSLSCACRAAQREILGSRPAILPDAGTLHRNTAGPVAVCSCRRADHGVRLLGVRASVRRT